MASGSFYLSQDSTYGFQGWLSWEETSVNTTNNSSYVNVTSLEATRWYGNTQGTFSFEIYINGSLAYSGSKHTTIGTSWVQLDFNTGATVYHNNDGSKSVSIYAIIYGPSGTTLAGRSTSGSQTVSLTTIPRASGISAPNGNIGNAITISIDKKASGHTNTVSYKINGQSSFTTIATKTSGSSISWTIPTTVYDYMGSTATSQTITLQTQTYNGTTSVGTSTYTITAYATSSDCAPTYTKSYSNLNPKTSLVASSVIIYNYSNFTYSIVATPKNGAYIKSITITNGSNSQSSTNSSTTVDTSYTVSKTFNSLQSNIFSWTIVDSRGFTTTGSQTFSYVAYFKPQVSLDGTAPNPSTGATTMKVSASAYKDGFLGTKPTHTYYVRYRIAGSSTWGSWASYSTTPTAQNTSHTFNYTLTYTNVYEYQGKYSDGLSEVETEIGKLSSLPVFDWSKDDFNINGTLTLNSKNIFELIYPVGSIYISTVSTNPNTLFGVGTWTQIKDTFLLAAGSSYSAGSTGGEVTHKLSVSEMPNHQHRIIAYSGSGNDYSNIDAYLSFEYYTSMKGWGGSTESTGGSQAHNNMPPYLVVYMWKRVS